MENNLSLIKKNYLNKNESDLKISKINTEEKEQKATVNKKKRKYNRRFKILKYCLNQLKYNNISIEFYKFSIKSFFYIIIMSLNSLNNS